jgi:hypothetical protein
MLISLLDDITHDEDDDSGDNDDSPLFNMTSVVG